jgi:glucokinase
VSVMVGVDIGGTKVALGLVGEDGSLHGDAREDVTLTGGDAVFVEGLIGSVRRAVAESREEVLGIGLGCAGTIDSARGTVIESPNLPVRDLPLATLVRDAIGLPVVLDNDANAAVWAEVQAGAARGLRHVVMLTLGTGVGGGLVLDGRLFRGAAGGAGELGHMVVMAGGEVCACGRRGCLEAYASGTALQRTAERIADAVGRGLVEEGKGTDYGRGLLRLHRQDRLSGESVGALALEGDAAAGNAVFEVSRWLGVGLANLANVFNPEMIVVGGGLSRLGDLLLEPAREILRRTALHPSGDAQVAIAELRNAAGVVGAGLVAWEEHRSVARVGRP